VLGTIGDAGLRAAAKTYDQVMLHPLLTNDAVRERIALLRAHEREVGRPGAPARVIATLLTSPELPDEVTAEVIHARALTYLQIPGLGDALVRLNGWDDADLKQLREDLDLRPGQFLDMARSREEIAALADIIPASWIATSCAVGSQQHCADRVAELFDAGVDEVLFHAALPAQLAGVVSVLRGTQ
jgi:alkanesulfonate monooxygenase SsuD/methylene tetrahydromethanopterin reductase-like flavin-dependent oxidoreductase (luciferase family)